MKIRADLHNHLRTSDLFSHNDFNAALDIASERLGEGGIFALANFTDSRYEKFIGLRGYDERVPLGENRNGIYVPQRKISVVKAQEIATKQGHLLVLGLGYDVSLRDGRPLEDTIKEIKDKNGISVGVHVCSRDGIGGYLESNPHLIGQIDAVEAYNGEALPRANTKSQKYRLAFRGVNPDLGILSSSDGHSLYELGNCWTELDFDFSNTKPSDFVPSLRTAIRKSNGNNNLQMKTSYRGIADHAIILPLWILRIKLLGRPKE